MSLHKIDDKTNFVEVYHIILKAVDAFQLISPNIPRQFLCIVQHLYADFYDSTCYIREASNTYDLNEKTKLISNAKVDLMNVFTALEVIVRGKGLTIGGANTVIDILADAVEQCNKWLSSIRQASKQDSQEVTAVL